MCHSLFDIILYFSLIYRIYVVRTIFEICFRIGNGHHTAVQEKKCVCRYISRNSFALIRAMVTLDKVLATLLRHSGITEL